MCTAHECWLFSWLKWPSLWFNALCCRVPFYYNYHLLWLRLNVASAMSCNSSAVCADGVLSPRMSSRLSREPAATLPRHNGERAEACVQETSTRVVPAEEQLRARRRRQRRLRCSNNKGSRLLRVPDRSRHGILSVTKGINDVSGLLRRLTH